MTTKNNVNAIAVCKLLLSVSVFSLLSFGLISCHVNILKSSSNSEITREFTGITTVDISTVSGNCKVMRGNDPQVKVHLTYRYEPADAFEPVFIQTENVLKLEEKMLGSNSGSSEWILKVPEQMNVIYRSASGMMILEDISGKIEVRTASGDINAKGIKLMGNSEFTSASGNVNIAFSESPKYDVLVSSASGDASIAYNNNPIVGTIEMHARITKGNIVCPYKFDTEKEELLNNQEYIIKSVTIGRNSPNIKIYTASGDAVLEK